MGDKENGLAQFPLQPFDLILQVEAHDRVDGAEGFIHEQDVGFAGQGPGHSHSLLLPTGELRGVAARHRRIQADHLDELHGLLTRRTPGFAPEHRHGGDIVHHRAVGQQTTGLQDVPDGSTQTDGVGVGDI